MPHSESEYITHRHRVPSLGVQRLALSITAIPGGRRPASPRRGPADSLGMSCSSPPGSRFSSRPQCSRRRVAGPG
eukprot:760585-Hanusia_phi.AAC.2